jgi:ribosomal subunit interface protein
MQLSVKGKQIDVGDALRHHVESTLSGVVDKYFAKAIEAHAVFSREAHLFRADLSVHIGRDIVVQGQGEAPDAYAAFDSAADRVAKRLRRYKRRLRDHHGKAREEESVVSARSYVIADEPGEDAERASGADGASDQPVIIAEMVLEIPTVTVGEAVMRMDLADAPNFVFRNSANGGLNIVYRRRDGHIGWLDPDFSAAAAGPSPKKQRV